MKLTKYDFHKLLEDFQEYQKQEQELKKAIEILRASGQSGINFPLHCLNLTLANVVNLGGATQKMLLQAKREGGEQ
jgi:hypothetical protein